MNEVLEQFASDKLTSCFVPETKKDRGWGGGEKTDGWGWGWGLTPLEAGIPQEKCCWGHVAETTGRTVVGKIRPASFWRELTGGQGVEEGGYH